MQHSHLFTRLGMILFLFSALIIAGHFLLEDSLNLFFRTTVADTGGLFSGLIIFAGLAGDVLLPVPSSVMSVWAVVAHGFVGGFLVVWSGMMAACVLAYWLGAGPAKSLVRRFITPADLSTASSLFERFGWWALVLSRAVPVLAEASVVSAGLLGMAQRKYLLVCALSNAGIALAYALAAAWAQNSGSFALAFFASIALPLSALSCYKLVKMNKQSKVEPISRDEQLLPTFTVQFRYPLCFTRQVFDRNNPTLINELHRDKAANAAIKVQFFVDQGVLDTHPKLAQHIAEYCAEHKLQWENRLNPVPGAEAAKTREQIETMHNLMLEQGLDRQSYVIAIGGGGVLDAVGYAAATFHRGIRIVRLPTTVLAQNDAGVGVKNGINSHGIKNLLGCFTVPHAIINDASFLESLTDRDFRSGFAEAIKVALIRDAEFYHWLAANIEPLNARQPEASAYLIKRCAELHLNQICHGGDPFEMGSARPLDYGHWSAHKLESLTEHALSHGEAVAIGMALDALYAVEAGLLSMDKAESVLNTIHRLGFDLWHPALNAQTEDGESALLRGLEEFRQHLGGQLCITLLTDLGETLEANHIDSASLLRARDKLANYHQQRNAK